MYFGISTPLIDSIIKQARPMIEETLKEQVLEDIVERGYFKSIEVRHLKIVDSMINEDGIEVITENK